MLSWIKIMERMGYYGISPYQGVTISDKYVEHPEECPVHICIVSDSQWQFRVEGDKTEYVSSKLNVWGTFQCKRPDLPRIKKPGIFVMSGSPNNLSSKLQ